MPGYALQRGEGRTYDWFGHLFTIKAAAAETDGQLAFWEFTTKKGDEPHDHTHDDVDEIFYVLEGSLTVRCGDGEFEVGENGFVFLPRSVQHGYTIHNDGPVHLLGLSTPSSFGDHIELTGKRLTKRATKARRDALLRDRHV
ncbi:MAG: cupin domain-containing protein [Dehalococcoidia bacterium]